MSRGFGGDRFCVAAQCLVRQMSLVLDDVCSVFRAADGRIADKYLALSLDLHISWIQIIIIVQKILKPHLPSLYKRYVNLIFFVVAC